MHASDGTHTGPMLEPTGSARLQAEVFAVCREHALAIDLELDASAHVSTAPPTHEAVAMVYIGGGGPRAIVYCMSSDGITWTVSGRVPKAGVPDWQAHPQTVATVSREELAAWVGTCLTALTPELRAALDDHRNP